MLPPITQETQRYILAHKEDDVRTLALKRKGCDDVDINFALQQIDGWQRARTKLPMWASHEGIIYPPHISMEQCSSEATALYKQQLVRNLLSNVSHSKIADLTGGFGVDFSYMSQGFEEAFYIEQQEHLCDITKHNFDALGMTNSHVINGSSEDILPTLPDLDIIYLDPARRDTNGKKTYAISDCTPDVTSLLPQLLAKARFIVVKLSPMLDHREAIRLLHGVSEVHIISVHNECKETLLVISKEERETRLVCVNDENVFETKLNEQHITPLATAINADTKLFVPNSSVMKAGCFGALCDTYHLAAVDKNSHLFVPHYSPEMGQRNADSTNNYGSFPGRIFTIKTITSLNKRNLRNALSDITQANIAVRNFPLSVDALKAKLKGVTKLRDGGDIYIFATTIATQHVLLICQKY